jgi:RNA polymerase sigma-70 factor (ECF subfamily)
MKKIKKIKEFKMSAEMFNELYKINYGIIFNYVNMKLGNIYYDAEGVTDEVFMKAGQNFDLFDAKQSKLSTWLYNIAKNEVIDTARKNMLDLHKNVGDMKNSEGIEFFQFPDNNSRTNDLVENKELRSKIDFAMSNLKPEYQKIAELYFIQDLSYDKIAILCEMPLNSVKGAINRIKTILQADLKKCLVA